MFRYTILSSIIEDMYDQIVEGRGDKLRHQYEFNVFPVSKSETL